MRKTVGLLVVGILVVALFALGLEFYSVTLLLGAVFYFLWNDNQDNQDNQDNDNDSYYKFNLK